MKPWLLPILVVLLLLGCDPDPKLPPKQGAATSVPGAQGGDASGGGAEESSEQTDPLAGSVFDKAALFEIYEAEQAGGAARLAALKKHRLADAKGAPVPTRVAAYERALKRYASGDPEGWSVFLESIAK